LLVAVDSLHSASCALHALGFREQLSAVASYTWVRRADGSTVDLHDSLFGADCPKDRQWATLSTDTESMCVGGIDVEVLSHPPRLLYVALHAAQHGGDAFQQPLLDLERALSVEPENSWREAAVLGHQLQATAAFVAGLRLHAEGARLAERLDESPPPSTLVALHAGGAPDFVVTLERLATAAGLRARLRLFARRLAPPSDYMRWKYPLANRGSVGLALAYLWRPASIIPRLPSALLWWRRARRKASS
jgi:hypothetical protein